MTQAVFPHNTPSPSSPTTWERIQETPSTRTHSGDTVYPFFLGRSSTSYPTPEALTRFRRGGKRPQTPRPRRCTRGQCKGQRERRHRGCPLRPLPSQPPRNSPGRIIDLGRRGLLTSAWQGRGTRTRASGAREGGGRVAKGGRGLCADKASGARGDAAEKPSRGAASTRPRPGRARGAATPDSPWSSGSPGAAVDSARATSGLTRAPGGTRKRGAPPGLRARAPVGPGGRRVGGGRSRHPGGDRAQTTTRGDPAEGGSERASERAWSCRWRPRGRAR